MEVYDSGSQRSTAAQQHSAAQHGTLGAVRSLVAEEEVDASGHLLTTI
jgi:hypothetical protein